MTDSLEVLDKPSAVAQQSKLFRLLLVLPKSEAILNFIDRAGFIEKLDTVILVSILLLVTMAIMLSALGVLGIAIALLATFFIIYMFLKSRIRKRRQRFLAMLPDALDIIVRSVKSGYPINAAIGMVAESLPQDVGIEFLRIMNEASYGYTLGEAVERFAQRMDEPDVSFFSVVVNLQQETGGNLAEILSNLSNVIRQRQQLRLKIRALSAEGRITVVILVGIAACMVAAVQFFAPGHFDRLFSTSAGHSVMIATSTCFGLAFLTIRKIINFKI